MAVRPKDFGPGESVASVQDVREAFLPLLGRVQGLTGYRGPQGAWFVLTKPRDPGSKRHRDIPGATAILHLTDIPGGGHFIFSNDGQEVEFKKNRLVVLTDDEEHFHMPPIDGERWTLVLRFTVKDDG